MDIEKIYENIYPLLGQHIPSLIGALIFLIVGWIIALLLSSLVKTILQKTTLDNKIAEKLGLTKNKPDFKVETFAAKIVYYVLMLIVLVGVFSTLQLEAVTKPFNVLLEVIFQYIPNIIAAATIIVVAWCIASLVKLIIVKTLDATNIDEKFTNQAGLEHPNKIPLSLTIANLAYWFVYLLFLPILLSTLQIHGLLVPIEGLIDDLLAFLPNLLGSGLILFAGWFAAKILKQVTSGVLVTVGIDRFGEKAGVSRVDGQLLSSIIGTVVYGLILIPTIIASLNALKIDTISKPATEMLSSLLQAIPSLIGAVAVLGITYLVAKVVSNLVVSILTGFGFNKILSVLGLEVEQKEGTKTPSELIGYIVLVGLMLFASTEAANLLGFTSLSELLTDFLLLAGQVLLGIIILGFAIFLSNFIQKIILSTSDSNSSKILSQVSKFAILFLGIAMAVRQMGLANDIINIAFGLLLGGIAFAFALAFGLGCKDIAAKEVENFINQFKK